MLSRVTGSPLADVSANSPDTPTRPAEPGKRSDRFGSPGRASVQSAVSNASSDLTLTTRGSNGDDASALDTLTEASRETDGAGTGGMLGVADRHNVTRHSTEVPVSGELAAALGDSSFAASIG